MTHSFPPRRSSDLSGSGTIDCNSRRAVIGGPWGDTGRQCIQAGVAAFNCDRVEWSGFRVIDSCLDGLTYGHSGLTGKHAPKPLFVRDVIVDRVGSNRTEEQTSELQSLMSIPYAVFCLKKKKKTTTTTTNISD